MKHPLDKIKNICYNCIIKRKDMKNMKRNTYKMETSKDFTAWDLNCRWVIPHKERHNRLEKTLKRKHRRTYKNFLKNALTKDSCSDII